VIVADGQVDTDRTGEVDFWTAVPIDTEDWLDSPDAVQAFLNNGGVEFLIRNPDGGISNAEIPRGPVAGLELEHWGGEAHATWAVSAVSNPNAPANGNVWWVLVDAQTAEVNATARQTEKFAQKYLTAHEALTVAQKVATKWQADAQLMEMLGWINYDDKMADTGKSGDWLLRFRSDSSDKVFSVSVADGKADTGTELDWPVTDPVTAKWFDSPVALKSFKFSNEYAAFSELFPDHEFTFWLKGDATLGYNWRMLASVAGVMLVSRTYVAESEATETPAPTATVREATETPTVEATQTPTLPSTPVLTVTLAPAVSTVTVTLSTALTATPALTVTLPVTPAVKPAKAVTMTVTVTATIRPTPIVTPTQVVTPTTPAETATPQRRRRA